MRDLESYIVEAQRQIGKWGGRWMRNNEDVIANVASAIIRAEHDHDPTKGASLSTLRCVYGRRQIWAEYRSMKRKIVNGIPLPMMLLTLNLLRIKPSLLWILFSEKKRWLLLKKRQKIFLRRVSCLVLNNVNT